MSVTCHPGRLKNSREFRSVYERGQRHHSPFFTAFFLRTTSTEPRFGFTVTRKIGNAVVRNRCKRRLREVVRRYFRRVAEGSGGACGPGGFDLVLNAKSALVEADFSRIEAAFERLMRTLTIGDPGKSGNSGEAGTTGATRR